MVQIGRHGVVSFASVEVSPWSKLDLLVKSIREEERESLAKAGWRVVVGLSEKKRGVVHRWGKKDGSGK